MTDLALILYRFITLRIKAIVRYWYGVKYISIHFPTSTYNKTMLVLNAEEAKEFLLHCSDSDFENIYNSLKLLSLKEVPYGESSDVDA
jgi:hypothetical protein